MICLLMGSRLGLGEGAASALVEAALLHDIGKTRVPVDILKKAGVLDKLERRTIETHTTLGAEILAEVDGIGALTATAALEHHRTPKGGGYPSLGDRLPHPLTQIVSVADIYEAMTGARTYRPPAQPEQACLVLARLAGDRLNASLVKAFVNTVTFFPIGTVVRTSRDETGVVVRTNASDPLHPVIAPLDSYASDRQAAIDTSARDDRGEYSRHIVESVRPKDGEVNLVNYFPRAES